MKWVKLVERRESVLMLDYLIRGLPAKYTKKVLNYNLGFDYYRCVNREISWVEEELAKVIGRLRKDIGQKGVRLLKSLFRKWIKLGNELLDYSVKISKLNFKEYSNKELLRVFKEFSRKNHNLSCSVLLPLSIERILDSKIRGILEERIGNESKLSRYFLIIATPSQESESTKELISFLNIINFIKKNNISNFENNRKVISLIKKHIKSFGWINARWYIGDGWSEEDMFRRVRDNIKLDCKEELKKINSMYADNRKQVKEIAKELRLAKGDIDFINAAKDYVFLRTFRTDMFNKAGFVARPLLTEIAGRMGLKYNDIIYLTSLEIIGFLESGKQIPLAVIRERQKAFAVVLERDNLFVYEGRKLESYVNGQLREEIADGAGEIKGNIANHGIVSGTVKIVKSNLDLSKVKKGDILIAPMTAPDFVPAMERASAFVTDEGGILCHAAIISREMDKPCITGTKIATKTFKDGDLVEVDADNGVVKRLNKKDYKPLKQKIMNMRKPQHPEYKPKKHYIPDFVVWFKELNKKDIPLVGGKGANLGEMFSHFPVPNGFCVTVNAYKHFLDEALIGAHVHGLLDKLNVEKTERLEKTSKLIRYLILKQKMPDDIKKEIIKNYGKLKNKKVAIRSSATAEDLPKASFAGQQDTYLNIEGEQNVVEAVQRCWASLFTSRAIYYREKNNFKHRDVLISVVVQEMVDVEYAGVMFTVDPVNKKHILVEVVEGLGEQLVSGQVTPNTYFMNKGSHKIEEASEHFKINKKLIEKVSRIGEKIEDHYKKPQDVEFCIDKKGALFIVQSRPITTL